VPPLALADVGDLPSVVELLNDYSAVALFVERAQMAKHDFQLTEDNARAVAEICATLDGLPLAIELAAARMKLLTARDLQVRLTNRLNFLVSGARDLPNANKQYERRSGGVMNCSQTRKRGSFARCQFSLTVSRWRMQKVFVLG